VIGMVVFSAALLAAVAPAAAAPAASGALAGVVVRSDGGPVDGATVVLEGPLRAAQTTDAAGRFRFVGLPAGRYALLASKAGFAAARLEDLRLEPDAVVTASVALAPSSFSSLREIGRIATGQPARAAINTSAAAVSVIAPQALLDQGRLQVTQLLNQTPGIITTTHADEGANGASRGAPQATQIRGALPYETESLIDGHPVSVGADGTFSPLLVKPGLLQDVEVVKGPGATGVELNAAIGGSVNYRTLEPTRVRAASADFGADGFGGLDGTVRATGTAGRVGYAFAATADGTRGGLNQDVAGSGLPLLYAAPPYTIDGRPVAASPLQLGASGATPQYEGFPGIGRYREPLYVCCSPVASGYDSHAALVKLRYGFSPQTALTVSVLDGESRTDAGGARAQNLTPVLDYSTFAPPAGYSGSVAAGTPISFDGVANVGLHQTDRQRLVQGELRSALGATTVLARYYAGTGSSYLFNGAGPAAFGFSERAWGGIPLCPAGSAFTGTACALPGGASTAPTLTFFDGQLATFRAASGGTSALTSDYVRGYSFELDRPVGAAVLTLAVDRSLHDSRQYVDSPTIPIQAYSLAPGSAQRATTVLARAQFALTPQLGATLSDHAIAYASHFSGDGGATWGDVTRTLQAPRLGVAWRPFPDLAWRLGVGASVAPPYINLLSSLGSQPIANTNGSATGYLQNANGGQVRPETAFGYDLGLDRRFGYLTFSGDVYLTNLRDLFLRQTVQNGSYTPPTGPNAGNTEPLYVTQTENLARARFEGVELSVRRAPPAGFGFLAQGSLQRAYPYALPPGFHATAAGPLTSNLAVLPGVNFQPSGPGYNGLSYGRVPYAQGYGEISARTGGGALYRLGLTYYGANNAYNRPAFGVVSATVRVPLSRTAWLQLAGDNLTGAYDKPYYDAFGGVPVPLVDGKLGAIDGVNVGPTTVRVSIHRTL
jgi:TonB dependent receptor/Carboxypeptidase regulatory-like domain/TonB-dependent Receptor Plug Domain